MEYIHIYVHISTKVTYRKPIRDIGLYLLIKNIHFTFNDTVRLTKKTMRKGISFKHLSKVQQWVI